MNRWKDTLGIIASVTCAIHCAATPILLAFLPALKLTEWMASPQFHQAAAVICVGLVSISIWPAFRLFRDSILGVPDHRALGHAQRREFRRALEDALNDAATMMPSLLGKSAEATGTMQP